MKKNTVVISICVLACLVVSGVSRVVDASVIIQPAPTSGLVAYWTFDAKTLNWTDETVADTSANGHTGTLVSMAAADNQVAGKRGQGLFFDGNLESVSLASNPVEPLANANSACTWANTQDLTVSTGGFGQTIINFATDASNSVFMGSIVNTGALFVSYQLGGNFYGGQTSVPVFSNNTWVHVCYVWNGSGITLYANGTSVATTTNSDSPGLVNTIGARNNLGEGTWFGTIDDLRVYSRALTATEIRQIYQSGALVLNSLSGNKTVTIAKTPTNFLTSGLIGHWSFDGSKTNWASNTTQDSSGNGNTGTMTSMSTTTSPAQGKIGQGLSFDGVDDYVDVGDVSDSVRTVSFWIKTTDTTEKIIDLNGTETVEVVSGTVTANNFTSPTIYVNGAVSSTITANTWYHVAVTTSTAINASGVDIGRITSDYFLGALDDVRMYNRALSATEARQLYSQGR